MDSQPLDYWIIPNNFAPNGSHMFEIPSDFPSPSSISGSPDIKFESFPTPIYQGPYSHMTDDFSFSYPLPLTPSDLGSADESPFCSPRPLIAEVVYPLPSPPAPSRTHTTSGRRRAQNRAAQRAFRERKEKHARDLEAQLSALTAKHRALETSHAELQAACEKLRKTIELLTKDGDGSEGEAAVGGSKEAVGKMLEVLCAGMGVGVGVKGET